MKRIIRIILILGIGAAVFAGLHYSAAEQKALTFIKAKGYVLFGLAGYIDELPFLISAAGGTAAVLILSLILLFFSRSKGKAKKIPDTIPDEEETKEEKNDLYRELSDLILQYTKDSRADELSSSDIYQTRSRNAAFLRNVSSLLLQKHIGMYESIGLESGNHPELLAEEARVLLQKALFSDFLTFDRVARPDILEQTDISWELFSKVVTAVGEFSFSLKSCFEFYLLACSKEKNRIDSLSSFGVIPITVGTPHQSELKRIEHEQILGKTFNYEILPRFYEEAVSFGLSFNPSIPDTLAFFDTCIDKLISPLNYLLARAKRLFTPFQFTRTEGYQRIEWIRNGLYKGDIAPESARHFLDTFVKLEEDYAKHLALLKINPEHMPKGMVSPQELEKVKNVLGKMKPEGDKVRARAEPTKVIYQTGVYKEKSDQ